MTEREQKIRDLKAAAYDLLATIEHHQRALQECNAEIVRVSNEPEESITEEIV